MHQQHTTGGSQKAKWGSLAHCYDRAVFSLTSFAVRREQILARLIRGSVLQIGCGSTGYLNRDMVDAGHPVVATDFCPEMLTYSEAFFSSPRLIHKLADNRELPFRDNSFDNVVSVNSILPPERKELLPMFSEACRVLKPGGAFVGFLVSFESTLRASQKLELQLQLDPQNLRVWDTTDWQCFHSKQSIMSEMSEAGFDQIKIEEVALDTPEEIRELERIYGVDLKNISIFEHLVRACKGAERERSALAPRLLA